MSNQELRSYIDQERASGRSNEQIRASLIAHGWDPIVAHRAILGGEVTVSGKEPSISFNTSNILLLSGLACIFIAILAFATLSWPQLSPLSRFLVVSLPNVFLFAIGSFLAKGEDLTHVKEGTHTSAMLMLPASTGVFIYQFGFYHQVDSYLAALSFLIPFPAYLYFLLVKKRSYSSLLVLVGAVASFVFLAGSDNVKGWVASLITVGLAVSTFAAARFEKGGNGRYLSVLESASTILFIFALPGFFTSLAEEIFGGLAVGPVSLITSIAGGGLLLLTSFAYGKYLSPVTRLEVMQQRFIMFMATVVMFMSLLGASEDPGVYTLVSIGLATLVALVGAAAGVKLLFIAGIVGGLVNLLSLLFGEVSSYVILIALVVIGFIAIGLSIVSARVKKDGGWLTGWMSMESLGVIGDEQAKGLQNTAKAESLTAGVIILRVILVFVAIFAIQMILGILFTTTVEPRFEYDGSFTWTEIIRQLSQPI